MFFSNTAAVILAAGYGQLVAGKSKLDFELGGVPMLVRVVLTVLSAGKFDQVALVINPLFGDELKRTLAKFLTEEQFNLLAFYEQEKRNGTAGAVGRTLPHLPHTVDDVFVTFGDMPLWRTSTVQNIVNHHLAQNATITLATLEVPESDPAHKFGRIVRNGDGSVAAIIEPGYGDLSVAAPVGGKVTVNPSLYVFKRWFLRQNLNWLTPHDKGDGREAELWLPDLVGMAHEQIAKPCQGDPPVKVCDVPLRDADEARGVNTLKELAVAEQLLQTKFSA